MNCQQLAQRLAAMQPDLSPVEVARLCLLILSQNDEGSLTNDAAIMKAWKHASFRLEAAQDQHSAVTHELDAMCGDDPVRFSPDQLWTLLRTIKVQSQVLELYTQVDVCSSNA